MDEFFNNFFLDELEEAHGCFEFLVDVMREQNISYPYDDLIKVEKNSYLIVYSAICQMNNSLDSYYRYIEMNGDFFLEEKKIYMKYFLIYVSSIITYKMVTDSLSTNELNRLWYIIFAVITGIENIHLVNKDIKEYRNNNISFIKKLDSIKKEYDDNFKIANREIQYMIALNRNLQKELDKKMTLIKK